MNTDRGSGGKKAFAGMMSLTLLTCHSMVIVQFCGFCRNIEKDIGYDGYTSPSPIKICQLWVKKGYFIGSLVLFGEWCFRLVAYTKVSMLRTNCKTATAHLGKTIGMTLALLELQRPSH